MNSSHKTKNTSYMWAPALLITVVIMGKYLFMSTRSTLWDRDEPRFARAAVEMVESGNYLVPAFNGKMWPDKPPLAYWLMSVPVRLLGPSELACRFFSAVGTAVACFLTFCIGRQLFGEKAGLWAMVILALTLILLIVGSAATSDAVLLPINVAVMALFVNSIGNGIHLSHMILIGGALGLGMLTKGPIGLMPVPAIATVLWFERKNRANLRRDIWLTGAGLVLGFLVFALWAVPANKATGGEFLRVFIGRHIITRALKPMEHHGGNLLLYLPYYLPVIVAGFFPWTLHLPGALSAVIGGRVGGRYGRVFLLSWMVPTFIIMTLAATKLPHYILFIWPALALAVGGTIAAKQQDRLTERDKIWLRRGVWFFCPPAFLMALGLMIGPLFLQIPGLRWSGLASGIVLLIMTVLAVYYQRDNRPVVSAEVLLICILVFEIPVLFGLLPAAEQIKISPPIAGAVKAKTPEDVPVATYKYSEPTLNFYLGRQIEPLGSEEAVVAWAKKPERGVLIIPTNKLNEIQQNYGILPLDKIKSKKGFNYSKGKTLEVAALVRQTRKQ
jgi:4-amino-4-deoxy-L-arabinose transferase-like glycosyltransferase